MPCLSASEVMIHEEALYQVYVVGTFILQWSFQGSSDLKMWPVTRVEICVIVRSGSSAR